jgi:DNA topoisomerase-1
VTVKGEHLRFRFRGKSGRQHEVDVRDGQVAKIISKLQDLPGQELFQYIGEDGEVRDVRSQDVNDYLREITNEDFSAKDFRTWAGTLLSALALKTQGEFETKKQAKANIKTAICAVAELLGNTPAICRKCYVHPAVLEAYLAGDHISGLSEAMGKSGSQQLRSAEAAVLRFLRSQKR